MKKRRQRPRLRGLPLAGRAEIKCSAASVCVSSRLGGPSHGHFPFLELAGHWDPLGWVLADEVPEFLRSLGHLSHQHWSAQQDLREPWPGPPQMPSPDSHLAHDAPSMSGHEAGSWGGGALSTLGPTPTPCFPQPCPSALPPHASPGRHSVILEAPASPEPFHSLSPLHTLLSCPVTAR